MSELDGPEAREVFMAKVRKRMQDGVFGVDPCHGMVGGPAVLGPTLIRGWTNTAKAQQEAEKLAHDLNGAWAWGYEQALADLDATKAVFEKAFTPSVMGIAPSTTDHPFRRSGDSPYCFHALRPDVDPGTWVYCNKIAAEHVAPVRECWVDSCQKPYGHDGTCDRTRLKGDDSDGKGMAGGSGR